jgi:hypothetical protein
MESVLCKKVMPKDSPLGIFLFVSESVVTVLLPALFLKKSRVFHFSIDGLQNMKILLFIPANAIDFSTQLCGTLSNAFW